MQRRPMPGAAPSSSAQPTFDADQCLEGMRPHKGIPQASGLAQPTFVADL
eukprot:CAMPEP_0119316012 /NCGR_PEP_ID=MMETSP1333-20130426/38148_1 /TAXON_ID=418940 /ORGANISM="Scyphosphaera apsteinii, Strain RCC1455" /LENGTH=49 /DNA_ID= /DNA_START= /DNA_END= /DNA_ORIENTATION=